MSNPFGGSRPTPVAPAITPPAAMPDPSDPAVVEAKRRAAADALSRGGRASTLLTGAKPASSPYDTFAGKSLG